MNLKRVIASGVFMLLMTAALIALGRFLPFTGLPHMLAYEASIVALSALGLVAIRLALRTPLAFFGIGSPAAAGRGIKILMVKPGESWLKTGLSILVIPTLGTGIFMVLGMRSMGRIFSIHSLATNLPWIVLLSACNSWAEELIYRLAPASLMDHGDTLKAYPLLSAIIFGAAHWWGSPGGPIGIVMSGLLGWVLAISVRETKGLFWALLIHLVQDLVIFGTLFGYGMIG